MAKTLATIARDLDDVALVALEWLEGIGDKGTLPVTRPELMQMLRKATGAYEKWDEAQEDDDA